MKTKLDVDVELEIALLKSEIISSWGETKVLNHAIVNIINRVDRINHSENYEIKFFRNQISGMAHGIVCKDRAKETTTEHTFCKKIVEELCEEKLNNY